MVMGHHSTEELSQRVTALGRLRTTALEEGQMSLRKKAHFSSKKLLFANRIYCKPLGEFHSAGI